jgi:hypothetical protein
MARARVRAGRAQTYGPQTSSQANMLAANAARHAAANKSVWCQDKFFSVSAHLPGRRHRRRAR